MAGIAGATVTVIFADVEGSTALLERLGQTRWVKALAEYEELLGSRLEVALLRQLVPVPSTPPTTQDLP